MGKISEGGLTWPSTFKMNVNEPLDDRVRVSTLTDLTTASVWTVGSSDTRYLGMIVFVQGTGKLYCLIDAASPNSTSSWMEVGSGGGTGTVTSVGVSVPTGFSVSSSPITTSGTIAISFASGYSLPTTAKQNNWDTAFGWGNHAEAGYVTTDTHVQVAAESTNADRFVTFSSTGSSSGITLNTNTNFKFNPSTGNLSVTKLNGVAVGSTPKFSDTTYGLSISGSTLSLVSGGTTASVTLPTGSTSDTQVTQTGITTSAGFHILLKNSNDNDTETAGVNFGNNGTNHLMTGNPHNGVITAGGFAHRSANNAYSVLLGNGGYSTSPGSATDNVTYYLSCTNRNMSWRTVSSGGSMTMAVPEYNQAAANEAIGGVIPILEDASGDYKFEDKTLEITDIISREGLKLYDDRDILYTACDVAYPTVMDQAGRIAIPVSSTAAAFLATGSGGGGSISGNTQTLVFYGVNGTQVSKTFYVQ